MNNLETLVTLGTQNSGLTMLLIFDNKDSALLTLLDESDATLGPGLISIPDIINKIQQGRPFRRGCCCLCQGRN
jgi:hypothetical protein